MHRGRDPKRVIKELYHHRVVIKKGLAMKKHKLEKNNRVIVLFEQKRTQSKTMEYLQQNEMFSELADYFIFKNLEEPEKLGPESFYSGWLNIYGEEVGLY